MKQLKYAYSQGGLFFWGTLGNLWLHNLNSFAKFITLAPGGKVLILKKPTYLLLGNKMLNNTTCVIIKLFSSFSTVSIIYCLTSPLVSSVFSLTSPLVSSAFYLTSPLVSSVFFDYLRNCGTVSSIGLWGRSMGAVTALMHTDKAKLHSKRVEKIQENTRNERKRWKLHSKRVEKIQDYTRNELRR